MSRRPPRRDPAKPPRDGDTLPATEARGDTLSPATTRDGDTPFDDGGSPGKPGSAPRPPAPARAPRVEPQTLAPEVAWPWHRYEDLAPIGVGGGGEVRRVRDRLMDRTLAMKILLPSAADSPAKRARFLAEARLSGRLQHPGIVPIHDCGEMPDGRLWFTMTEVRGQTLRGAIGAAYEAEPSGLSPVELRRLVEVYARACEAVAYAHGQGVVHRDLKPDNVLVGARGEVYVVDWGIARSRRGPEVVAAAKGPRGNLAPAGGIVGTPAYMPPEQARGDHVGPPSDVYALGAILYEILCGRTPYEGAPGVTRAQVLAGPPPPLATRGRASPPEELGAICDRAMTRAVEDRFPDATALAAEVRSFLDGARRRARATALTREAAAIAPRVEALRARAAALREASGEALARVESWDPVEEKARGWALEDEARAHAISAAVEQVAWEAKIHGALTEAPDLADAHEAFAAQHARELARAEDARDAEAAARAEALLWHHDRGRFAALLDGSGAISLATDPPGARVMAFRYVERGRRLTAEPQGTLGETPLHEVPLLHGSYLLSLVLPGHREVRYPVRMGRGECWDGAPPGSARPAAIPLLREETLGPDDVYVPRGWFAAGGDRLAAESLPAQRVWVEGFVMRRHPVTVEEYLAFLNDLVAQGRAAEAEAACPCIPSSMAGSAVVALYPRDASGRYRLPATRDRAPRRGGRKASREGAGAAPRLDEPAASMTWSGAMAYAAWWAARTGEPWRLPSELEREKAARGVDGRPYPWGDHPEPTWANVAGSAPGAPRSAPVGAHPLDESPYGVRGLAGNTRDWCVDAWTPAGPPIEGGVLCVRPPALADPALRSVRGGAWTWPVSLCRAAARLAARPGEHGASLGLRLVRPIP